MKRKLQHLTKTVKSLADYIEKHDLSDLRVGGEHINDILSHLVYWHRIHINTLWAMITGSPHPLSKGRRSFHEYDEIATKEYALYDTYQLIDLLIEEQEQFVAFASRLPGNAVFRYKPGAEPMALDQAIHAIDEHMKRQLALIKHARSNRRHHFKPIA